MPATPLLPGRLLHGRYRVELRVAQGGAGTVYRAHDLVANVPCALKHVVPVSPSQRAAFAREADLLSRLRHPSLPTATDLVHLADRSMTLVMTYVHGRDLGDVLVRHGKPLGVQRVLQWVDHVLDALAYLHALDIVHHDIKPRNVRLDDRGRAVLVDLGLAQCLSEPSNAGQTGYTPAYAPPEQLRGERTDARSDLYALGATVFELLARRTPPSAASPLPDLCAFNPSVPRPVATVVQQAMALAPDERHRDAHAMRMALADALRACPASLPLDDEPAAPVRWQRADPWAPTRHAPSA